MSENIIDRIVKVESTINVVSDTLSKVFNKNGKIDLSQIFTSSSFRESGIIFGLACAIVLSSLWSTQDWELMIGICTSLGGLLLGGWIKKNAEERLAKLQKDNEEKDDQIGDLKSRIATLELVETKLKENIQSLVDEALSKAGINT